MALSNIPDELKARKQWVAYKLTERGNGKAGKVPVDPKTLRLAKANDPTTWGSYEEAVEAVRRNDDLAGIGIELGAGLFGIDLDGVLKDNVIDVDAELIISTLNSYTEYSPSRTGFHILCYGDIPEGDRRNGFIEMYSENRFFTVTGEIYRGLNTVESRTIEAAKVHAKYIYRPTTSSQESPRGGQVVQIEASDSELLEKMFNSSRGSQIRALWDGDTSAHGGDHSAADLALIRDLAYWTNGDAARMDSLFRSSGLMRDKWDRKQSGTTWGALQIKKVLESFTPYTVQTPLKRITSNGKVIYDESQAKQPQTVQEAPKEAPAKAPIVSAKDYLLKQFTTERAQFKSYTQRKTGFKNIDSSTGGLYPGLYVIGAQSSLGKTTFIHQLGDQLAQAGDYVLFFSLEQSLFELTTKSLAREAFKEDPTNEAGACSSIELRSGGKTERVKRGYNNYLKYADRVIIKECNFDENIESIEQTVKDFIKERGVKPIVIIDYLQIIPAQDPRLSDKEKTDQHMKRLKILQRNNDLVLFVISALNRANYLLPISFESFRESSGIEYTADVVWGMQYSVISTGKAFQSGTDSKIAEKRQAIKEAKAATPRRIELVCLKNRYGRDYSAHFDYYPKYDYFMSSGALEPVTVPKRATI